MNTTDKELSKLRKEVGIYLEKWVTAGGQLTRYKCTSCGVKETTRQPDPMMVDSKGYWDSMMRCTHCGDLNFVKVYPTGKTEAVSV